ncbi:MAG: GH92 family glycosyl hydrolase [Mycobacteriales bacterium]
MPPILERGLISTPDRPGVSGFVRLDVSGGRTVRVRLATSFLGLQQAGLNMALELRAGDSVDTVAERAEREWAAILGLVEVEGASTDQLTTLYSNLYRLYLYPNIAHENVGTAERPQYRYASPFRPTEGEHDVVRTGSRIVDGKLFVNNGFWDTYRTTWPAYALLTPERAAELLDGFVQHFRDGGWMARWSSPGYADCMVGTSSDIVIADALVKDIALPDVAAAYDSAVKNATVPADDDAVGRKGLSRGIFTGYIDTGTPEGMSWSLESAINDFGLMVASELLRDRLGRDHPRAAEFAANAVYFRSRAVAYRLLFDESVGFFQGRTPSGDFRRSAPEYDPRDWGGDYTETNGWGMAFTAPHDGAGLAALYGGADRLRAKLDAFFAEPENAIEEHKGHYGQVIHEMTEARNVRMGMFGISNQPAHHIPYLYAFAGAPHRTQEIVAESVRRLFLGSEIGQGYPGDEDNGEMSAWWVFGALGIYPVTVGSPTYALTAPAFVKATVHLATGNDILINAPAASPENVYIQSVHVNGHPWDAAYLPHDRLAAGCTIDVALGPKPSTWGAGSPPPSISDADGSRGLPMRDITRAGTTRAGGDADALVDDRGERPVDLGPSGWISHESDDAATVRVYTVTASRDCGAAPSGWILEASADGTAWTELDRVSGAEFRWPRQTRAFLVAEPAAYRHHRLTFVDAGPIAQVEFLA